MSNEVASKRSLIVDFGNKYNIDSNKVMQVLKDTAFKDAAASITDSQMIALLVIANSYGLNPFTREIFAFPSKGSIIPVVSVDGWTKLAHQNNKFDGVTFVESENIVTTDDGTVCPEWIECGIYRKDCSHPFRIKEYFIETYKKPFQGRSGSSTKGPWQTHPRRMLRHKSFIQAARLAFGFSGIYDRDEAENIKNVKTEYTQEGKVYETKTEALNDIIGETVEPTPPEEVAKPISEFSEALVDIAKDVFES